MRACSVLSVWGDDPRPTSVLVSRRSVPGVGSRHEQLWSHGSDRGERRLEDQHGLCGPQKSRHSCGRQLVPPPTQSRILPVKYPILTCLHVYIPPHPSACPRNSTQRSLRRSRRTAAPRSPAVRTAAAPSAAKTDRSPSGCVPLVFNGRGRSRIRVLNYIFLSSLAADLSEAPSGGHPRSV